MKQTMIQRVSLLAAAIALTACAAMQPQTAEEQVQARAQQRWDALMKGDLKKGYEFSPPSYRGVTSYEVYRAKFGSGLKWKSAMVAGATCKPEQCKVKIRIEADVPLLISGAQGRLQQVTSYYDETWIREDGKWWIQESL
jgi:hypothetical protein